jgi:DNA-binding MarR family transcriptional regulator
VTRPHYITPDPEEVLDLWKLARASDPATSHQAAANVVTFRGEHARRILEALAAGPAGQTDIAARAGMTVAQVSKRLKELREAGAIERTGREVAAGECEYRICTRRHE